MSGIKQFVTECTLPNATIAFVTSPNVRGSFELVWTCFATLLACVYTVLHFNVHSPSDHPDLEGATWVKKLYNYIRRQRWLELACWCTITVFIPEIVYTSALIEFLDARDQLIGLHQSLKEDLGMGDEQCAQWKMVHMFYANMGGFVILHEKLEGSQAQHESKVDRAVRRIGEMTTTKPNSSANTRLSKKPHIELPSALSQPGDHRTQTTSGGSLNMELPLSGDDEESRSTHHVSTDPPTSSPQWLAEMAARLDNTPPRHLEPAVSPMPMTPSIRSVNAASASSSAEHAGHPDLIGYRDSHRYDQFHLNAHTLRRAINSKLLPPEAVDPASIEGLTGTDWFARLLVMFQLIQFFIGVIARVTEDLPISELEVVVSAFALCSIIPYIVQWHKPQNAQTTIVLATYRNIPHEILTYKNESQAFGLRDFEVPSWVPGLKGIRPFGEYRNPGRAPPAIEPPVHHEGLDRIWICLLCWGGTVFGAIHLAAWHLVFPTFVDKWLWRGAALATTGLPFVWSLFAAARLLIERRDRTAESRTDEPSGIEKSAQSNPAQPQEDDENPLERRKSHLEEYHPKLHMCWQIIFFTGIWIYILGRLTLTVEMIRTLFYLPPRAYLMPNWSFSLPHIT